MFLQHLRHAARLLLRTPGFTAAAVICLALGIAVNATMYSLFDALVLNPFPYPNPDRLISVRPVFERGSEPYLSGPEFAAITAAPSAASAGASDFGNRNLTGIQTPERLVASLLLHQTLETYGIAPRLGRTFTEQEHRADMRVVIISDGLWERRFGRDPAIIGRTIGLNRNPHTIVGVLPPRGVLGERGLGEAELYLPRLGDPAQMAKWNRQYVTAVRLRPGASVKQLQAELDAIALRIEEQNVSEMPEYKGWKLSAAPIAKTTHPEMRAGAGVLLGTVVVVMLIACVNVANLILARAARRTREVAIRRAIGADRRHLLSQYFAEGLVLSSVACAIGVLLAFWGLDVLLALLPSQIGVLPVGAEVAINSRVLLFIGGIVLATAVAFGLLPVLQGERHALAGALHEGARGTVGRRARRFGDALVAVEIALSVLLLVAAGLAIRSYTRVAAVHPGFQPDNVLIMRTTLPTDRYKPPQITAFFKQLQERVSQLPGVKSAGVANQFPPIGGVTVEFQRPDAPRAKPLLSDLSVASTGFMQAISLSLRKGRFFTPGEDTVEAPPVVIVNEQFVKAMFDNEDPLGKSIAFGWKREPKTATIVGVVGSARNRGLEKPPEPEVYIPLAKDMGAWNQLWLALRTEGDPAAMLGSVREQVRSIDPDQPVYLALPMREALRYTTLPRRAATWLLAIFGGLALLLAIVGLYGVIAYMVTRRTQEVGVRVALGASRREILRLVLRNGLKLALAGLTLGLVGAAGLARLASSALYGIEPYDMFAFTAGPVVLLLVALLASYVPALRATKVDPIIALRYD
jgi:predicted permease